MLWGVFAVPCSIVLSVFSHWSHLIAHSMSSELDVKHGGESRMQEMCFGHIWHGLFGKVGCSGCSLALHTYRHHCTLSGLCSVLYQLSLHLSSVGQTVTASTMGSSSHPSPGTAFNGETEPQIPPAQGLWGQWHMAKSRWPTVALLNSSKPFQRFWFLCTACFVVSMLLLCALGSIGSSGFAAVHLRGPIACKAVCLVQPYPIYWRSDDPCMQVEL